MTIQDEYVQTLNNLVLTLQSSYEQMKSLGDANIDFNYSQAIASRIRAFYIAQSKIKDFLGKKVA